MSMKNRPLAMPAVLVSALVLALAMQGDAATTLAATVRLQVTGGVDNALDLTKVQAPLSFTHALAITNGTGAGQADVLFTDTRSVAAAEDLDVSGGSLTAGFGATFT